MKSVWKVLASFTPALSLILALSTAAHSSTPKVDPVSPCSDPPANFQVAIGFDSTNNVPTVSSTKNSVCVSSGNSVTFQINPNANITSWDVKFPTTNPVFPATCAFGTVTTGSSQSCTVVSGPSAGDYVYEVDVWVGGGNTKYTLDPKVVIKPSGRRRRRSHPAAIAPANP